MGSAFSGVAFVPMNQSAAWPHLAQAARPRIPDALSRALLVTMLGLALWTGLLLPAAVATQAVQTAPELFHALRREAEDDPSATLADAQHRLAMTQDATTRFWLLLGMGRLHAALEDLKAAQGAFSQAESTLASIPGAGAPMALWLEVERTAIALDLGVPEDFVPRMQSLGEKVKQIGDPILTCSTTAWELWGLVNMRSHDEAWLAAEKVERCAQAAGLDYLQAMALAGMGLTKSRTTLSPTSAQEVQALFERALAALGSSPLRLRRAGIEFDFANAMLRFKQFAPALAHVERAKAISRQINDRAGMGTAAMLMARVLMDQRSLAEMLPVLAEAQSLLEGFEDGGAAMTDVMELRILALARLKRPEVLSEIDRARQWDLQTQQPANRAPLARAMAEGYASQGRYQRAYAELVRANAMEAAGKSMASETQVLRLQARYDTARRAAENAELRHNNEAAQLALRAQVAERRALWALVTVLGMVAAGGGVAAWRGVLRRRALAELALTDELTGCPNRRAVLAYAQAQWAQARRLSLPLTVAMIDLDHFKRVNDSFGHAAGDELLRAFAQASQAVLRGQDRLGRWGGEEWLLVMPGTGLEELRHVFERMQLSFSAATVAGMPTPHGCTFSMGGAAWGPEVNSLDRLIALADKRMYAAKASGRNALRTADAEQERPA